MRVFKITKLNILKIFLVLFFSIYGLAQAKTYNIRMATSWPTNFPVFEDAVLRFKEYVEQASNGQIKVRIDSADKHKAPLGIFDLVRSGNYEMGHSASYYYQGKDIATILFTTLPFGMNVQEQYAWFYYGGGIDLMNELYQKYGMYSYPGGNTGVQMGGWFRKEIKSLDDLKGLKIRTVGIGGDIMAATGANVVNIAPGELFAALERGVIDAAEWVGPAMDLRIGLQKVADYYYTGWAEPAAELQFLVNKKFMDSLPKELQDVVKNAIKLSGFEVFYRFTYENAKALEIIKKDYPNVKIVDFPPDVIKAFRTATNDILEKYSQENPFVKKVLDSQNSFLKLVRPWSEFSEYSYLRSEVENKENGK